MARKTKNIAAGANPEESAKAFDDWCLENGLGDLNSLSLQQAEYLNYPSGSFMLDLALGAKPDKNGKIGFRERSITEIFGHNGSLKSATGESLIHNICDADPYNRVLALFAEEPTMDRFTRIRDRKQVKVISFFDGMDQRYAKAERGFDTILNILDKFGPEIKGVFIDSIAALLPFDMAYDEHGEPLPFDKNPKLALRASLINNFLARFVATSKRALLFMTNQLRDKIPNPKDPPSENSNFNIQTTGGNSIRFYANYRIKSKASPLYIETPHSLTDRRLVKAWDVTYDVKKSKECTDSAGRVAESRFWLGENPGFDRALEIFRCAEYLNIITRAGSWYDINGVKFQGEEQAVEAIRENPETLEQLRKLVVSRKDEIYKPEEDNE